MLADMIGNIRRRPLAQRRAIGIALYVSLAAVFLAISLASFQKNIGPQPSANREAESTADAALESPTQTFAAAFQDFVAGIKDFARATHELAAGLASGTPATALENELGAPSSLPPVNATSSVAAVATGLDPLPSGNAKTASLVAQHGAPSESHSPLQTISRVLKSIRAFSSDLIDTLSN